MSRFATKRDKPGKNVRFVLLEMPARLLHSAAVLSKPLPGSAPAEPALPLAALFAALEGCPTPALGVDPQGRVLAANAGARRRLGLRTDRELQVRDLLGVGWRELELVAAEGLSDLVLDLPARPAAPSRSSRKGWRVPPQPGPGTDRR